MPGNGITWKGDRAMQKKSCIPAIIFSFTIAAFLMLSSFFNAQSFRNSFAETAAMDNAVVAGGVVSQLEYTLKYGKTLDNYYGIESVFEELHRYCAYADRMYLVDGTGTVLYTDAEAGASGSGMSSYSMPKELDGYLEEMKETGENAIWTEEGSQQLLLPVRTGDGAVAAALGITYPTAVLDSRISAYTDEIYQNAVLASAAGILLFLGLFFLIRKNPNQKKLKRVIIPTILISNAVFGILSYGVFRSGYMEIARSTADIFGTKITYDIDRVVSQGVPYGELYGMDRYFKDILRDTGQIDSVHLRPGTGTGTNLEMEMKASGLEDMVYELPADSTGKSACLVMTPSESYIRSRLRDLLLNVAVSVITSLMIAGEVVSFILALLSTEGRRKRGTVRQKEDRTYQPLGIVRGLSFFFAMFQYMATAFVSIVLASIYKPIVVFGYELPYDIVMALPLSIQILTSLFTAWLSGTLINRNGWKPIAVSGVLIMSAGTVSAAMSTEPYLFLLSQVIIGTGLGLAKTSFDIYAVLIASDEDMERYTSNSNAGIIIGMSCSSAIGAVIAGSFGYSGAYLVMGIIGCGVALLVILLGMNIMEGKREAEKKIPAAGSKSRAAFDFRFFGYLMFMVLPYFFIMMFVDYFFPVYANQQGMSTEMIGYVFLAYGMCTSYFGVLVCNILAKRFSSSLLMPAFLSLTGIGILLFSVRNIFFFSVVLVLIIAVADGVMPSQQFKYVYSLPYAKRAGFAKAVSIEGIFSSGIRGFAPVIFGLVMMQGSLGLFVVAVLIIVSAVLFTLINKFIERKAGGECE